MVTLLFQIRRIKFKVQNMLTVTKDLFFLGCWLPTILYGKQVLCP